MNTVDVPSTMTVAEISACLKRIKELEDEQRMEMERRAIEHTAWVAKANQNLSRMVGRTVKSTLYNADREGTITITFTDDSTFELSASGDDMTHISFELKDAAI